MLALVTGASSGIGLMYARELARQGHDLIVVSNMEEALLQTAREIEEQFHVNVLPIYKDLTDAKAAEELHQTCLEKGLEVDILINNAGVFFFNYLCETSMSRIELMLNLHVMNTTRMTRIFGEDMRKRGKGYILNMSSLSTWMAMPGIQCYNATKSYINNFSRSMWYELHPYGVNVLSVTPGAVATSLFGLSDKWMKVAVALRVAMPPEKLVKHALKALFKGKKNCMPGVINHISKPILEHMPDWVVMLVIRKIDKFMK